MKYLILLLLPFSVSALEIDWDTEDTYTELVYQTTHFIDWQQTYKISESCHSGGHYTEVNPLLGTCPDKKHIDEFFLVTGLAHFGMSALLGGKFRTAWQYGSIMLKVNVIAGNYSGGIRVRF